MGAIKVGDHFVMKDRESKICEVTGTSPNAIFLSIHGERATNYIEIPREKAEALVGTNTWQKISKR